MRCKNDLMMIKDGGEGAIRCTYGCSFAAVDTHGKRNSRTSAVHIRRKDKINGNGF